MDCDMSSLQPLSQESSGHCQEQSGYEYPEHCENYIPNEKPFVGSFQGLAMFTSLCDSPELTGNFSRDESAGESNFGGSFFHANAADGTLSGGNFHSAAIDDAQVVPDFEDLIETITVDTEARVSSVPMFVESVNGSRLILQDEQREKCRPRRRTSERDELEIYLPCVLTPIPVDRLYSTLSSDDSPVFKFPTTPYEVVSDDKVECGLSNKPHSSGNSGLQGGYNLESFDNLSVFSFSDDSPAQDDIIVIEHRKANRFVNQCPPAPSMSKPGEDCNQAEERTYYKHNRLPDNFLSEKHVFPPSVPKSRNFFKFRTSFIDSESPKAESKGQNNCATELYSHNRTSPLSYSVVARSSTPSNPKPYDEFPPNLTDDCNRTEHIISFDKSLEDQNCFHSQSDHVVLRDGECYSTEMPFARCADVEVGLGLSRAPENTCPSTCTRSNERSVHPKDGKIRHRTRPRKECRDTSKTSDGQEHHRKSKRKMSECDPRHADTRDVHNDMEKQRRTNMKTRFENLRMEVPELLGSAKASKIVILRKAFEYIRALEKESVELENAKRSERQSNIELLESLQWITSGGCS